MYRRQKTNKYAEPIFKGKNMFGRVPEMEVSLQRSDLPIIVNIIKLAACVLLVFNVIFVMTGNDDYFTFSNLLSFLLQVPTINMELLKSIPNFSIFLPSWLDWLSPVASIISDMVGVLAFFALGLVQCLVFVLYFVGFLFGFGGV